MSEADEKHYWIQRNKGSHGYVNCLGKLEWKVLIQKSGHDYNRVMYISAAGSNRFSPLVMVLHELLIIFMQKIK